MLFLCVNVYCHRVTTQLQLINIIIIIISAGFGQFDRPPSDSSTVHIKIWIISEKCFSFTNVKYSCHFSVIIPKSGIIYDPYSLYQPHHIPYCCLSSLQYGSLYKCLQHRVTTNGAADCFYTVCRTKSQNFKYFWIYNFVKFWDFVFWWSCRWRFCRLLLWCYAV